MGDKLPEAEKKARVTLYKKDGVSYALTLLATLAEFVYIVAILDVMPVSYLMGLAVIVNIFFLFLLFTCAVKINVYEAKWAGIALVAGGYMVLRALAVVPLVLKPYDRQMLILAVNLIGAALLLPAGLGSLRKSARRGKLRQELQA